MYHMNPICCSDLLQNKWGRKHKTRTKNAKKRYFRTNPVTIQGKWFRSCCDSEFRISGLFLNPTLFLAHHHQYCGEDSFAGQRNVLHLLLSLLFPVAINSKSMMQRVLPRLVLHFDVNATIMVSVITLWWSSVSLQYSLWSINNQSTI